MIKKSGSLLERLSSLLEKINSSANSETNYNYFSRLTELLIEVCPSKLVLIGRCTEDQTAVQTISCRIDGAEQTNFTYTLQNTPCENVIQKGICVYPDKVQEIFPQDKALSDLNAKSYIGSPVFDRNHEAVGLVVLIGDTPLDDPEEKKLILQFISAMASGEFQRLSANELLIQSEKKYREVVENQSELIVRWLPDGTIVFANQSYLQFHQLKESEILHKSVFDLVKDRTRFEQKVNQISPENNRVTDIHLTTNHVGEKKWHEWSDHAFFDSTGKVIEIQSIGRDVSIRKETEREIIDKEEFSQSIFSAIEDHIVVIDKSGNILSTNKSWKEFAKKNSGTLQATNTDTNYFQVCERAILSGDETAKEALAGIKSVISGDELSFELEYPCHSETIQRWFIMRVAPMRNERGGAVITHTDISEKKIKDHELMLSYNEIIHTQYVNQALINGDSIQALADHILTGLDEIANVERSRIYLYNKENHTLILHSEKSLAEHQEAIKKETGVEMEMAIPKLEPGGFYNEVITEQNIILTSDPDQIKC